MTADEVDAVLAILSAHWAEKVLTEEETATWERHLAGTDFDVGVETAELLIDHLRFFPRIAEFRETATTVARRKRMDTPALPVGEPAYAVYARRGLAHVEQLRAQLRGKA